MTNFVASAINMLNLQLLQRQTNTKNVRDGINGADLMKMDLINADTMNGSLSLA